LLKRAASRAKREASAKREAKNKSRDSPNKRQEGPKGQEQQGKIGRTRKGARFCGQCDCSSWYQGRNLTTNV
jgi:hypothetical protein